MSFAPIAIVGRACVLPGALDPEALWQLVRSGKDLLRSVPDGRWGIDRGRVLCPPDRPVPDRTWSDRGGYVEGFDTVLDPTGFGPLAAEEVLELDPLFQWVLHTARQALRDADTAVDPGRIGAVFGNLSFPSRSLSQFAEAVWRGEGKLPHPRNRFNSGLPALLLEQALGLGVGAFALDAACASSLVAIKTACDWLHDGHGDLVLAGAVNRTDDLFIHVGFGALQALSKTGQSRPFHAEADGLVPAEGAGFVALRRLADAERDGDTIHGVIRGVGLSNDGKGQGFLVPSSEGQVRALRTAYGHTVPPRGSAREGVRPADISLLECHATGTRLGDATELEALAEVFGSLDSPVPLGSLKSNLGHLITTAGVAGLIKVCGALEAGERPPTLHVDDPTPALRDRPFRLLTEVEPWTAAGPRRAAVSAFGFGGNNAHLIVEEHRPGVLDPGLWSSASPRRTVSMGSPGPGDAASPEPPSGPIAIVGVGVTAADCRGRARFVEALRESRSHLRPSTMGSRGDTEDAEPRLEGRADPFEVDVVSLGVPPLDLKQTLSQQLMVLEAGREAAAETRAANADGLPRERTGVFVGMGIDPEIARYGARWRHGEGFVESLQAAGVIGTMPNISANRLNRQLDLAGPSCTVSAEERSGLEALALALRALRSGELDAAVVGAVDLSCEPVHRTAVATVLPEHLQVPGDAAVALVVKRLADAERDGDRIYAVLEDSTESTAEDAAGTPTWGPGQEHDLTPRFGHAHAASGLLHLAAAALGLHHRVRLDGRPWLSASPRRAQVVVNCQVGPEERLSATDRTRMTLRESPTHTPEPVRVETAGGEGFRCYTGENREQVLDALNEDRRTALGELSADRPEHRARLVLVDDRGDSRGNGADEAMDRRADRARAHLERGLPPGAGVHFRKAPVVGELAFVFTSAGSAYRGMGRELLHDLPELGDALGKRFRGLAGAMGWAFEDEKASGSSSALEAERRLWATSSLCQLHAELSQRILGLRPAAALGYSSGESNSLFALGAWRDMDAMRDHCHETGLFTRQLGGEFEVVRRLWGEDAQWQMWSVLAPVDEVRAAVATEARAHLAIVHTENDCVLGGEAEACARVVATLGRRRCHPLAYNLCVHAPELDRHREAWLTAHRWETFPVPDVRFYSGAYDEAYAPETERCAQAILGQANRCLDFPKMVEKAWADGVRIFVEHGPGGSCSRWIRDVLGPERLGDAVVVALDRRGRGADQVRDAVGALLAAGLELDPQPLLDRLAREAPQSMAVAKKPTTFTVPAHPDPVRPDPVRPKPIRTNMSGPDLAQPESVTPPEPKHQSPFEGSQIMEPAPTLPPVVDDNFVVALHRLEPVSDFRPPPEATQRVEPVTPAPGPTPATAPTTAPAPAPATAPAILGQPAVAAVSGGTDFGALAAVHSRFLQQQAEVHQRFLAGRSRMLQMAQTAALGGAAETALTVGSTPVPMPGVVSPGAVSPGAATPGTALPGAATPGTALPASPGAHAPGYGVPPLAGLPREPVGGSQPGAEQSSGGRSDSGSPPSPQPSPPSGGRGGRSEAPWPHDLRFPLSRTRERGLGGEGKGGGQGGALSATNGSAPEPKGLTLSREQLEIYASGKISEVFGPLFEQQDAYPRQVRMPEPPLLLADRMTGLDAEPGVAGLGTIWTETDVREDSWYLHRGRMPAGILIESGQADLMLISWMGADFLNKSERVYRLLGCTLTFRGELPIPGDTLRYDIHVDGHARHDAVRLFFFHYDCRIDGKVRISVRNGQAGFFSDAELADSDGILWTPEGAEIVENPRLDPPHRQTEHRQLSAEQIRAFAAGRPWECFGPGFETTQAHVHTPRIQDGRMLFLEEVTHLEPSGGPWGRGYLRARTPVTPDDWFFDGHFKNDPCMPGTLMFEGCFQALSVMLTALGFTLERDGWRFQPVPDEPIEMRCRGQVTPSSKETIYEVFVEELIAGPEPTIYADLLCTVDGLKAFHARRVGLRLVPDWPLASWPELLRGHEEPKPVATVPTPDGGTFELGYRSLLACAWGKPSDAFGPLFADFDGHRKAPRLPGPPYHFMSRILSVTGTIGVPKAPAEVVVEYDVPADAWYLAENGCRTMPFAVLLEAALQPCGWLANYVGCAVVSPTDLMFRNLDGTGTQHAEVFEDAGCLRTEVVLKSVSNAGGMTIVAFDVRTLQDDRLVYDLDTVFGFFPAAAFENQAGLAISEGDRALLEDPNDFLVDLDARPETFYRGGACLPGSKLDMLNRVTGFWPEGGSAGLGALRAVKDVHPGDWYFKAHFYQDPVQPGSLGIEAMIQLLQFAMLELGMDQGIESPRFEPLALGRAMTWKYRGQVVPTNQTVTCTLEITERGVDGEGAAAKPYAVCDASLWVDGLRIYSATNLGMRIVSGAPPQLAWLDPTVGDAASPVAEVAEPAPATPTAGEGTVVLDPSVDLWLADHCPTWNRPALPMMSLVDLLASAVDGPVVALRDVQVKDWVDFAGPRSLRTEVEPRGDELFVTLLASTGTLSGEDARDLEEVVVASARIQTGEYPSPPAALPTLDGEEMGDPYASGDLFHGPAFQILTAGRRSDSGASTTLDAGAGTVPRGRLHPALLDGALHGIPHDRLHLWSDEISDDRVAYPARIPELSFYGPTPSEGSVRCEVRFEGLLAPDLPAFRFQLIAGDRVWAAGRLLEACFPKGRLGQAPADQRRAFLRDHRFVPGVRLSRGDAGETRLSTAEVEASDWMPGTIEGIYGTRETEAIAIKEHLARREAIHPFALPTALPLNPPRVRVTHAGEDPAEDDVVVRDDGSSPGLDPTPLRGFWDAHLGFSEPWLGRDLWEGLLRRFVGRVVVEDPAALAALGERGALFLGNHQVQIESLLITNILSGLTGRPVVTMANAKHERRWIGWILRHLFSHPQVRDPESILYFDQSRPESMFEILAALKPDLATGRRSLFLHPQGTRSQSCRETVTKISSTFLDLAVELDLPVIPIRFTGGLPVEPIEGKLEFPHGYSNQDYWIGRPIEAAELADLPYAQRGPRVLSALNGLGPDANEETPHSPDPSFAQAVHKWQKMTRWRPGADLTEVEAVFFRVLESVTDPSPETRALLERARSDQLETPDSPVTEWLFDLSDRLAGRGRDR